jgi:polynucleotide 5'-kinase involved in rRNA processing
MSNVSTSQKNKSNKSSLNAPIQSELKNNQSKIINENDDFGLEDTKDIHKEKAVYKEEPLQLIEFQGSKFKLNPEALKIISSIESEIVVVSIVGKARTGKSYLMNLLLDRIGKDTEVNIIT